ncbi:MAG TPA: RodZ domain-containing protein [Steroidobacteraceae bacterium]|nr:RodZ domain-containing protein [Steroidobacteraceae bacterium]
MTSEAGGDAVRGIGARLRAAREKRGFTLLQAAEKLHVDPHTLEALEAGDFAALGADVYVRGHLRRYAEAVGESPLELQELYASGRRAVRPDLTRIPRSEPVPRSSPLMMLALLVVVGAALAGVVWWFLTLPGAKPQPVAAQPAAAGGSAEATAAPGAAEPAAAEVATAVAGADVAPKPEPAAAAPAAGARLNLSFSAPSWVEVSDASGRRLLGGLIASGVTREVPGTPPLHVVLGNAAAVTLQLNGEPVGFQPLVHRDGSAHFLIDASGRASAAAPRLAHGD